MSTKATENPVASRIEAIPERNLFTAQAEKE